MERTSIEKIIMLMLIKPIMKELNLHQGDYLNEEKLLEAAFNRFTFQFDGDNFVLVTL